MKKILLLLLVTTMSFGQTIIANKLRVTNNVTDNVATKVNVQGADGTVNTISKIDLQDVFQFASEVGFPSVGLAGKIYLSASTNKIYNWNGAIFNEVGGIIPTLNQVATAGNISNNEIVINTIDDVGLSASSINDFGIYGNSRDSIGVYGETTNGDAGVRGSSTSGFGVIGATTNGDSGIYGVSANTIGVAASSINIVAFKANLSGVLNTNNIANFQKNNVNQATISYDGKVTANNFIKSDGTSSQFLKADGSIDSNSYLTAATIPPVSATQIGIVNNTPLQELGGVDKLINTVRIGVGPGNGSGSTVVGCFEALSVNTTGTNNTAIGARALSKNTTGSSNTAVGRNSLGDNSTASYNSAFGRNSLYVNATGSENTAIGWDALYNSKSSSNTALGSSAGAGIITGGNNTYIGRGTSIGDTSNTLVLATGTTNRIIVNGTTNRTSLPTGGLDVTGSITSTANTGTPNEVVRNADIVSKANLASPAFTGVPTAPTAPVGTNTQQVATTAFVLDNASPNTLEFFTLNNGVPFLNKVLTIPNSVTTIGSEAFYNSQLTSITIGNSVTTIESGAFSTNLLIAVIIPNSVTSIGTRVFESNQIMSVILPTNCTYSSNSFDAGVIITGGILQ